MAEALTIARPYAEAIFKLATAKGASNNNTLQAWHDMLNLAATVAADERIQALIGNPKNFSQATRRIVAGHLR